jgi:hypothetical protein
MSNATAAQLIEHKKIAELEKTRRNEAYKNTDRNEIAYEEHSNRLAKKHSMFTSEFSGEESEFWGE